jgi:hypothetical protein
MNTIQESISTIAASLAAAKSSVPITANLYSKITGESDAGYLLAQKAMETEDALLQSYPWQGGAKVSVPKVCSNIETSGVCIVLPSGLSISPKSALLNLFTLTKVGASMEISVDEENFDYLPVDVAFKAGVESAQKGKQADALTVDGVIANSLTGTLVQVAVRKFSDEDSSMYGSLKVGQKRYQVKLSRDGSKFEAIRAMMGKTVTVNGLNITCEDGSAVTGSAARSIKTLPDGEYEIMSAEAVAKTSKAGKPYTTVLMSLKASSGQVSAVECNDLKDRVLPFRSGQFVSFTSIEDKRTQNPKWDEGFGSNPENLMNPLTPEYHWARSGAYLDPATGYTVTKFYKKHNYVVSCPEAANRLAQLPELEGFF